MTKRYTGGVVSSSLPTVNAAGASGVFLLSQQSDYQSRNAWPPYKVEKSLRFRNSASARLTRTPSVAGNKQIWTISFWLKTSKSNFDYYLFEASTDGGNNERTVLAFNGGKLQFRHIDGGSAVLTLETTQLFRDPSAWYHIVLAVDTTQATSSNRVKMYLNGSQITAFGTSSYPSQNLNTDWNGATAHAFGASTYPDSYSDGYFSEIYNIDGQALTPSSFGGTDKDGNWSPIAYTGTYGTNGFYVNFKDATSTTTLGYDYSGNGNHWTTSGISATLDSMIDVPEDQSDGTANNRGNYATLNHIFKNSDSTYGSVGTFISGNLEHSSVGSTTNAWTTFALPSSGKYYWEVRFSSLNSASVGIFAADGNVNRSVLYTNTGTIVTDNSTTQSGLGSWTSGDRIGIAYNADVSPKTIQFYRQNVAQGTATNITTYTFDYFPFARCNAYGEWNFGQFPFTYAPPSGFKALNTFNLPEPTIKQPNKYMDVNIWTGNGTSQNIVNNGSMQPDLVWVKQRNGTYRHQLVDAIRGATKSLFSSDTDAEGTYQGVTAFNSNGFSVGTELGTNENGSTFVGWQWNAGNANTTNTSGSITSIVRANPTAGFSIVTYTGNGTSGATVGHGLGVTPSMVILKQRDGASNWQVKHISLNANQNLVLNSTAAVDTAPGSGYISAISSTTLTLLNGGSAITNVNANNGTYVAYCFAPIAGYSAFGSYTGNGSSDGPFVHTGFRPAFVMTKKSSGSGNWYMSDNKRIIPANGDTGFLYAETTLSESDYGASGIDFLSNGFKIRNSDSSDNGSGDTIIYMAFAETPFKYARSR